MTTYTADDFKRAEFARREGGGIAARVGTGPNAHLYPWRCSDIPGRSDRAMADDAWVPVPLGLYTRHESPDLADGGVTAAAIEKETEDPGGPLDETVDFWRSRWKEAADHGDARDLAAHRWKEAMRENIARFRAARDFAEMCQKGSRAATVRAEKAEQERDHLATVLATTARQRDEADKRNTHPLTPDAITTTFAAMVAKMLGDRGHGWVPSHYLRESMRAAAAELTEPPARPEGAEELEAVIGLNAGAWTNGADDVRALADLLASEGVRVTGADR